MFQNVKDFLFDRGSGSSPAEKVRAFLFDELDSLHDIPEYHEILPILTTPYKWDNGHPLGLGNSEIIRNILGHLPTREVINLRRVNSAWNNTACEILRGSLSHVKLRPSRLKKFLKLMKKSWCNPFSSYAIRIERLDNPLTVKFLRRFPPYIVHLRVKICSAEIPEFTRVLVKMPLLEELHLIRIPEGIQALRVEYVPVNSAWKYGLYTFSQLKSITLESDDPSVPFSVNYDTCIVNLINSAVNLVHLKFINWESPLAQIFARRGLLNPKSLNGSTRPTSPEMSSYLRSDVEELFYKEMKFKAIKFIIDEVITFNLILGGIIKSKTYETLYHLSLKNQNRSEVFQAPVPFPVLVNLGLRCWEGPVNFHSIRKHFPSLQTIKLHRNSLLSNDNVSQCDSVSRSSHSSMEDPVVPQIKSVETVIVMPGCALDILPVDGQMITLASKLFPNLKQLFIQAEANDVLLEVYKMMPQLELLCVDLRGDQIEDEAFTGIPKGMVEVKGWHDCECPDYSVPDDFVPSNKGIGALKNLNTLIVRAGSSITNLTLLEGIVYLRRLETLWLLPAYDRYEGDKLTSWCLGAIADKLSNLKRLVLSQEVSYSEKDLLYLKRTLPKLSCETSY